MLCWRHNLCQQRHLQLSQIISNSKKQRKKLVEQFKHVCLFKYSQIASKYPYTHVHTCTHKPADTCTISMWDFIIARMLLGNYSASGSGTRDKFLRIASVLVYSHVSETLLRVKKVCEIYACTVRHPNTTLHPQNSEHCMLLIRHVVPFLVLYMKYVYCNAKLKIVDEI